MMRSRFAFVSKKMKVENAGCDLKHDPPFIPTRLVCADAGEGGDSVC